MTDAYDFSGRVALVTGGGSGLGREVAVALAKLGADVVAAGRRPGPIQETVETILNAGGRAIAVSTDVTDSKKVDSLVERTVSEFGRIDILVNNAGISGADDPEKAVWEITDEVWHQGIDGELTGSFFCAPRRWQAHGRPTVWQDRQRLLRIWLWHPARPSHVRRRQGGRHSADPGPRHAVGPRQRQRQLHRPRPLLHPSPRRWSEP